MGGNSRQFCDTLKHDSIVHEFSVTMQASLILIAEDEAQIAKILDAYLVRAGFRTARAADGETALLLVGSLRPDLVLLDLNLPKRDGFSVLASLRQVGKTPVIVISALDQDIDKLTALRIGADDYVTKPFNPNEVVARVTAVLRRSSQQGNSGTLRVGRLTLSSEAHEISCDTGALGLTPSEFRLLEHFMRRPGRVFSRGDLVDACLPEAEALDRTVDSHIANLRRKLTKSEAGVDLATVRGVGYRLDLT